MSGMKGGKNSKPTEETFEGDSVQSAYCTLHDNYTKNPNN